jgi:hypothetical protein
MVSEFYISLFEWIFAGGDGDDDGSTTEDEKDYAERWMGQYLNSWNGGKRVESRCLLDAGFHELCTSIPLWPARVGTYPNHQVTYATMSLVLTVLDVCLLSLYLVQF